MAFDYDTADTFSLSDILRLRQARDAGIRGTSSSSLADSGKRKAESNPYPNTGSEPDESIQANLMKTAQGQKTEDPNAKLGEGVGGTAGGLIGSIWGPIGQVVGKKIGTDVGGGIQEVVGSKHPLTDLSHRFIYNPIAEGMNPMGQMQEQMSKMGNMNPMGQAAPKTNENSGYPKGKYGPSGYGTEGEGADESLSYFSGSYGPGGYGTEGEGAAGMAQAGGKGGGEAAGLFSGAGEGAAGGVGEAAGGAGGS